MKAQELHPFTLHMKSANLLQTEGVIALCESLKTNTTLTDLSLFCESLVITSVTQVFSATMNMVK